MAGLYIHTPFCVQKCSYCDFFSAPPSGNQLETWHLLIQRNLELIAATQTDNIETIFFGGGTPSLLSPAQIRHILTCCRRLFSIDPHAEISLEANPATLYPQKLDGFMAAGVNRLSIGIQSFDDQTLKVLGRRHDAQQARQIFKQARAAGFNNISIDLIFALPDHTTADLRQEISQLLALAPDHVGIYGLSIEDGTSLALKVEQGLITASDEETYAASYLLLNHELTTAGYEHYEISNYALPGVRSRHNQAYWQRKTCLAAGAGAHGFDSKVFGMRTSITTDLDRYRQQLQSDHNPTDLEEEFNQLQAMSETLYLSLRTSDGINRNDFEQRFGISLEAAFPQALESLNSQLRLNDNRYSFTVEGWLLYDHLISHFL